MLKRAGLFPQKVPWGFGFPGARPAVFVFSPLYAMIKMFKER
jgi:hypothetical protein